jgi:hypothetical protein
MSAPPELSAIPVEKGGPPHGPETQRWKEMATTNDLSGLSISAVSCSGRNDVFGNF